MKQSNYYTRQMLQSVQGDELYHYGVMGMHWGVRRYQPYPAAYDGDGKFIGKKALKKQVKADKAAIDKLTKETSILGAGLTAASKRRAKQDKKTEKWLEEHEPEYHRFVRETAAGRDTNVDMTKLSKKGMRMAVDAIAAQQNEAMFKRRHDEGARKLQEMVNDYKNKYGEKNIRDIIYTTDKYGNQVVNERVLTAKDWVKSIASSAAVTGALVGGYALTGKVPPLIIASVPSGRASKGNYNERLNYQVTRDRWRDAAKKSLDVDNLRNSIDNTYANVREARTGDATKMNYTDGTTEYGRASNSARKSYENAKKLAETVKSNGGNIPKETEHLTNLASMFDEKGNVVKPQNSRDSYTDMWEASKHVNNDAKYWQDRRSKKRWGGSVPT